MTIIRNDFAEKIMVDYEINLISDFYFILLEIWELNSQSKRLEKKSRVINIYDNQIGRSCI